jgi:hypothetical protein
MPPILSNSIIVDRLRSKGRGAEMWTETLDCLINEAALEITNLLFESISFPEFLEQLSLDILQGCLEWMLRHAKSGHGHPKKMYWILDTLETGK